MGTVVDLTQVKKKATVHFDTGNRALIAWTQTDDHLAVFLRIENPRNPKVKVAKKRLDLSVEDGTGTTYKAVLDLLGEVQVSIDTYSAQVRNKSFKIQCAKAAGYKDEWERLVEAPHRETKSWLEYDWDAHDAIEEEYVEPDEKEQPDEEVLKKPRFEEEQPPVEESLEQKKERWASKGDELKKEREELRQKTKPKKDVALRFTLQQLGTLVSVVVLVTAIFTHFFTKWFLV